MISTGGVDRQKMVCVYVAYLYRPRFASEFPQVSVQMRHRVSTLWRACGWAEDAGLVCGFFSTGYIRGVLLGQ